MTSGIRGVAIGGCILALGIAAGIFARADDGGTSIASLKAGILTQKPQTKVAKVDRERLVVRRIDVVDEAGTIRMTLASPAPAPIVDGIQYKRAFPTAGLTVFDKDGNERGGFGVADIEGGAAVAAQDHVNGDAIGWRIMPDGSISFVMNERGAIRREPALGNHIVPTMESASRIQMSVAADGTPAIALSDKASRPRLRLTVNEEGFGAIEFLDAQGRVIDSIVPEAHARAGGH